jgi:hypothetical protein
MNSFAGAGIGLRAPHVAEVLATRPRVPWLEVHSENYFAEGGAAIASLERVRGHYPISLHGVGLALGSSDALDLEHLAKLKRLIARIDPVLVSEHLAWGRIDGRHFNDLLPLPYTEEALDLVCERVAEAQERLERRLLIENISAYYSFPESDLSEALFLSEVAVRTGCGILLDVNNAYVNERNHGVDAAAFIGEMDPRAVAEIHLAGFEARGELLIDTHGAAVAPDVWALYDLALRRFGPLPTLIEWDTDIPAFDVLEHEAAKAQCMLEARRALAA